MTSYNEAQVQDDNKQTKLPDDQLQRSTRTR
jgi:hypothetical protein